MANKLRLEILPPEQLELWQQLGSTPADFVLYGGTALALRLGHRQSVDFDFFSARAFDPERLYRSLPYLQDAEITQIGANTLRKPLNRSVFLRRSRHGDVFRGRRCGFCLLSLTLSYLFVALMPFLRPFLHNRRNTAY